MSGASSASPSAVARAPRHSVLGRPATWIYVVLVAASLFVVIPRLVSMAERPDYMCIAWMGALIQAPALLLFGWLILPRRRSSVSAVALSILIGATFCVGAALLLVNTGAALMVERFVGTPIIEEVVKTVAVVVVILVLRPWLRGPLDGLIIGFFVGFGFAIVENMLYAFDGGTPAGAWQLVIIRLVTQFGSHVIYTGIIGAGFAYAMVSRGPQRWIAPAAFAVGLGLHCAWDLPILWLDSLPYLGVTLVVYVLGIVVFIRVKRASAAIEQRQNGA